MNEFTNRLYARKRHEGLIRVFKGKECAAHVKGKNDHTRAHMINADKGGMCFESGTAFQPGTNVVVKLEQSHQDDDKKRPYKVHYGRVKWCREAADAGRDTYGVGVQIFDTVVQAEI